MKRVGKGLITLICVIGLVVTFGCAGLQNVITPCHINEDVIEYSKQKATSYVPWTTVFDAERIKAYMDYEHMDLQRYYQCMSNQDNKRYDFLTGRIDIGIADARQLQQKLFNPNGSIGMAVTALFGGTIGAMFINTPKKKETV